MSRTFAHDYTDGSGGYKFNPKKWEEHWFEIRPYGSRFNHDTRTTKPERFKHHGEIRVKLYKPKGRAWWLKPPSYCTRDNVTAPYRATHRDMLRNVVKTVNRQGLEEVDIPKFPGRLKNADWEWT